MINVTWRWQIEKCLQCLFLPSNVATTFHDKKEPRFYLQLVVKHSLHLCFSSMEKALSRAKEEIFYSCCAILADEYIYAVFYVFFFILNCEVERAPLRSCFARSTPLTSTASNDDRSNAITMSGGSVRLDGLLRFVLARRSTPHLSFSSTSLFSSFSFLFRIDRPTSSAILSPTSGYAVGSSWDASQVKLRFVVEIEYTVREVDTCRSTGMIWANVFCVCTWHRFRHVFVPFHWIG